MLFEVASSEIPLLIFTVLVPMGVTSMGLFGIAHASLGMSEEDSKKANKMLSISAIVTIVGLIASFAHLGSPTHVFGMASGIGASPLSNEIVVAGIAILVAVVYWIFALAKNPAENVHKIFGVVLIILGLVCALFTGLAYMMSTIATWNSPVGAISQIFAAIFGGACLAALVLALAGQKVEKPICMCALIGAVGVAVMVLVQGASVAGVINSAGMTLNSVMTQYWVVAVIAIVLAAIAGVLTFKCAGKEMPVGTAVIVAVLAIAALVLVRICFYGIFLSVGLF